MQQPLAKCLVILYGLTKTAGGSRLPYSPAVQIPVSQTNPSPSMKFQGIIASALALAAAAPGALAAFSCTVGTKPQCCDSILERMGGRLVIANGCVAATADSSTGVPGSTCAETKLEFCNIAHLPTDALIPLFPVSSFGYVRCSQNITVGTFTTCALGPVSVVRS
ncbi:hypothetical protein RB594_003508 [Gaeumannomyces avenae]